MNRHFSTARLASGVLFSPPADIDAQPDVWDPRKKRKIQHLDQCAAEYGAGSQGISSTPMMDYSPTHHGDYSAFPYFIELSHLKPSTRQIIPDNKPGPSPPPPSSKGPVTFCLPISRVSLDISIDGTISHTRLTQSFHNPSELDIPEARHTFPLYYGAVVTSFECKIGDSRRLQGVVKPTAQARREFEESKARKREAAALLEELTPEIFETSLGNIPANTTVEISLTYVHELKVVTSKEEKSEGLAITVPTSIAPRYATPIMPATLPEVSGDRLEITIRVFDGGTINPACCHVESNHPTTVYEGLQTSSNVLIANIAELHSLNSAAGSAQKLQHVWKYSSKSQPILKGDFVFVIQMLEETRLQSRAVITPVNGMGHAALMVSLRPNDLFGSAVRPDLFKGEILFVLDRSASMNWTQSGTNRRKIETMRSAMSLALSGLPLMCRFNIISFGSEVRGMWNRSQRADELENVSYAREYVTNVKADMRGTKVLLALKGAVSNREPSCPSTQIILITDGEIDKEPHGSILTYVWETRKIYGEKIRFFTLGIGDSVSHSVMESIAELGGGYCDVVDPVKSPNWEGRLNRMLRSVMEPDAWSCDINLGPGYKRQSLATSKFGVDDGDDTDSILYAQGPHPIPSLHPFRYKSFFFLLDLKNAELPKTVTIRTTSDTAKKKVYTMEVKLTQLREGTIHPLTVKMILRCLEDEIKRTGASEEQARLNAECLGTKYTISSNWTSFVAVGDESTEQTCLIDTYKSIFKEAAIEELLVSEREESSEMNPQAVLDLTAGLKARGRAHKMEILSPLRDYPSFQHFKISLPSQLSPINTNMVERSDSSDDKLGYGGRNWAIKRSLKEDDQSFPLPMCRETTKTIHLIEKNLESEKNVPQRITVQGINDDNRFIEYFTHSDANHSASDNMSQKAQSFTLASKSYIQDYDGDLPCKLMTVSDTNKEAPSKNTAFANEQSFTGDAGAWEVTDRHDAPTNGPGADATSKHEGDIVHNLLVNEDMSSRRPDSPGSPVVYDNGFVDMLCGSIQAQNSQQPPLNYRVSESCMLGYIEAKPTSDFNISDDWEPACNMDINLNANCSTPEANVEPSGDAPISWQDAAASESRGMFVLPMVVRKRLSRHFCSKTVERLHETLRSSSRMTQVSEEEAAVSTDTLMMIQYFRTHLADQEDFWGLLIDKAERALLLCLGYDEDQEDELEPIYNILLSSILHVHFPQSLKHASVHQDEARKTLDPSILKTCLACNEHIEVGFEGQIVSNRSYVCLADECYDKNTQSRNRYTNWSMFWDHQIKSGHILCPEINEGNEKVNAEATGN